MLRRSMSPGFLLLLCSVASYAQDGVLFAENFRAPLGDRWKQIKFHDATEYRVVTENSNACLMAFAAGGCSAFATKVDVPARPGMLCTWRWKIDHCPKDGTDETIIGFDHAARVFVAFDTWLGTPRTINYIWANQSVTNATFNHPFSARTKFIVVQSGNGNAGKWLEERRDIAKDWSRLFGEEPMPKIVGVGVFTDSHYTRAPLKGWYADIIIRRAGKE